MAIESKPTLADLLERTQKAHEDARRGPLPGVVVSYDRARQRADVDVPVYVLVDGQPQALPTLRAVPVVWPSGSAGSLTIDLEAGDPVYLVPAECDCSAWLSRGLRGAPPTQRRSAPSDYVAIPGGPRGAALQEVDEGAVVLAGDDVRLGSATATDYVALAGKVLDELKALRDWCESHSHTNHGLASLPAPYGVASMAASKVKAK